MQVLNEDINIIYASSKFAGSGHYKITVEVEKSYTQNIFSATTNNMPAFDKAQELEGQEKYESLYSIIAHQIEDEIINWIVDEQL